jgi:hypothetical protein
LALFLVGIANPPLRVGGDAKLVFAVDDDRIIGNCLMGLPEADAPDDTCIRVPEKA